MNELKIFENPEFGEVRTIERDGEPWFVGKDVAAALGYSNPRDALSVHVDIMDKATVAIHDGSQNRWMAIINESGLYSLILSSKLPTAKAFKRWITSEVIPSIRKHGAYITPDTLEQMIADPDTTIRLLTTLKEERQKRVQLENEAKENRPKVLFADAVATAHTSILIGELAKLIKQNGVDMGQNRLFDWMRKNGYLIARKGTDYNMPTQRSMELDLMEIKETTITNPDGSIRVNKTPKVTGKGQQYFIEKFLKKEPAQLGQRGRK